MFSVFLVGLHLPIAESTGTNLPYNYQKILNSTVRTEKVLTEHYGKEDVILTMPDGIKTGDLTWLSVWCRYYRLDMGHVIFKGSGKLTYILCLS